MKKYYKLFKTNGESYNGGIVSQLEEGIIIKSKYSGTHHRAYIHFCEDSITEAIDNISGTEDISVWEVEPLSKVYKSYTQTLGCYDDTYRMAKKIKLIKPSYEHLDYLTKLRLDKQIKDEEIRVRKIKWIEFKETDTYKSLTNKLEQAWEIDNIPAVEKFEIIHKLEDKIKEEFNEFLLNNF